MWIDEDEWWPVYEIDTDTHETMVEISRELFERYEKVRAEFCLVQDELRAIHDKWQEEEDARVYKWLCARCGGKTKWRTLDKWVNGGELVEGIYMCLSCATLTGVTVEEVE